mmetsp:Transcript_117681/g.327159  ORF Transcript_117681/g.327159 Transcript_117681/m.327159 type:complete len:123 (+) Transcript_117681:181-549(+)
MDTVYIGGPIGSVPGAQVRVQLRHAEDHQPHAHNERYPKIPERRRHECETNEGENLAKVVDVPAHAEHAAGVESPCIRGVRLPDVAGVLRPHIDTCTEQKQEESEQLDNPDWFALAPGRAEA